MQYAQVGSNSFVTALGKHLFLTIENNDYEEVYGLTQIKTNIFKPVPHNTWNGLIEIITLCHTTCIEPQFGVNKIDWNLTFGDLRLFVKFKWDKS